ncbi:MAG TPA: sigma 54-interacting transcriptional regulator [Kofleriaceae bacterium]|nr:sigma 54-interacting transcriptional regulator [Kofleriaceae bacterium]
MPGVVVVFTGGGSCTRAIPLATGPVEIGRGDGTSATLADGRVSRRHAQIAFDDGRCLVTDLGSQNGTFVDGELLAAGTERQAHRVIRVGDSLLVPFRDVAPFTEPDVRVLDGFVRGPTMQDLLAEVARAAQAGTTLHVRGESGTGKEGIALAFHRAGARAARPLVPVNCAAIPHAIAERLLFGAKRGTYSGADTDAPGYVQEADGGTLFLDEIAELDLQVQAKLLRVLESHEVLPLGASRSRKVDFALCSATNKDLRALVAAGLLREDLYFRIGRPMVSVPALRNRPEEIPALIARELAGISRAPVAHVSLVEQCLLRPWPGNVRELLTELRSAAHAALVDGHRVEARHLAPAAGTVFGNASPEPHGAPPPAAPAAATASTATDEARRLVRDPAQQRQRIEEALRANAGNVAATARALGLHRTQLRRLIERYGIRDNDDDDDDDTD